jgi:cell shape-determining protein MreC
MLDWVIIVISFVTLASISIFVTTTSSKFSAPVSLADNFAKFLLAEQLTIIKNQKEEIDSLQEELTIIKQALTEVNKAATRALANTVVNTLEDKEEKEDV